MSLPKNINNNCDLGPHAYTFVSNMSIMILHGALSNLVVLKSHWMTDFSGFQEVVVDIILTLMLIYKLNL